MNFKRAKVHDLGLSDGSNSKKICKCKDCADLRNRAKRIFKPWYKIKSGLNKESIMNEWCNLNK